MLRPLLEKLYEASPDAHRRIRGFAVLSTWERLRVEEKQQIDVGRKIELPASELAQGYYGETARFLARAKLCNCGLDCPLDRRISEIGEQRSHLLQGQLAGQIAECDRQGERPPPDSKFRARGFRASLKRLASGVDRALRKEGLDDVRPRLDCAPKKRGMSNGEIDRALPRRRFCLSHLSPLPELPRRGNFPADSVVLKPK